MLSTVPPEIRKLATRKLYLDVKDVTPRRKFSDAPDRRFKQRLVYFILAFDIVTKKELPRIQVPPWVAEYIFGGEARIILEVPSRK